MLPAGRLEASDARPSPPLGFDSSYLLGSGRELDLSRFESAETLLPGLHRVDVLVNDQWLGVEEIRFLAGGDVGDRLEPCFDVAQLQRLGVDVAEDADEGGRCLPIEQRIAHATTRLDAGELRLHVSVPQTALRRHARGYVDPAYWDAGIPAAVLGYSANRFRTSGGGADHVFTHVSTTFGVNAGLWQLRQVSSLSWQQGAERRWDQLATYAERPLPRWKSRLVVGKTTWADPFLGAAGFRGVLLASDERMLPESQRGFAPVVRGVATTNARVEVRQNGSIVRSLQVAPGPFEIDDLYMQGSGADLEVLVHEADGRVERLVVPYGFNPQLMRAGRWRYAAMAGQLSEPGLEGHPGIAAGSLQYGVSNAVTGYGAVLATNRYRAGLLGAAFNTVAGAWSVDATTMRGETGVGSALHGRRLRLGYGRSLGARGAMVNANWSRYDGDGALELRDVHRHQGLVEAPRMPAGEGVLFPSFPDDIAMASRAGTGLRSSTQLAVSIPAAASGHLFYLNAMHSRRMSGADHLDYQLGVRGFLGRVGYAVSAGRVDDWDGKSRNQYWFNLSLPLARGARPLSLQAVSERRGAVSSQRIGVSGTGGDSHQLAYGVSMQRRSASTAYAGSASYRANVATLSGSASRGAGYRQSGLGVEGIALLHRDGLTLGAVRGDTLALVSAPGAHGVRIENAGGARIGSRGYALAPYLVPYHRNLVALDPSTAPDVEIDGVVPTVVPHAGAVVKVEVASRRQAALLIPVTRSDGRGVPFGAEVFSEAGERVGHATQGSRLHVQVALPEAGALLLKWGNAADDRCLLRYHQLATEEAGGIRRVLDTLVCAPMAEQD